MFSYSSLSGALHALCIAGFVHSHQPNFTYGWPCFFYVTKVDVASPGNTEGQDEMETLKKQLLVSLFTMTHVCAATPTLSEENLCTHFLQSCMHLFAQICNVHVVYFLAALANV